MNLPDPLQHRTPDYPIETLFLKRWSPRAMNGNSISDEQLMTLFEAARWAPSSYNEQEWRFLYAQRDSESWRSFFELLMEANQTWCAKAAVLVVVCSSKVFARNGRENGVHSFDTGAAFENLCLQGAAMDLVVHGMAGFDKEAARSTLEIPDDFAVEAMIAVGEPGKLEDLDESYRQAEIPSSRKPVREFVAEGKFHFG